MLMALVTVRFTASLEVLYAMATDAKEVKDQVDFDPNVDIGTVIANLRADRGITQEQLATLAGTSPAYLSQIETGYRRPTLGLLGRIAAALETTLPVLFVLALGEDDVSEEKRDTFRELAPALKSLLAER